ncbi:hypothetical protein K8R62_04345 [bacterium]|nr:hypothetical protein [bacterium]
MLNFYFLNSTLKIFKEILYFPVWWYSKGAWTFLLKIGEFLSLREKGLALRIWIENIMVTMYGQSDLISSFISYLMRVFQIIFRGIIMISWFLICLIVFLSYLIIPILTVYQIIFQIF